MYPSLFLPLNDLGVSVYPPVFQVRDHSESAVHPQAAGQVPGSIFVIEFDSILADIIPCSLITGGVTFQDFDLIQVRDGGGIQGSYRFGGIKTILNCPSCQVYRRKVSSHFINLSRALPGPGRGMI